MMVLTPELSHKYEYLKTVLRRMPSLAVGLSGGVDSSLLLAAAVDALPGNVLALTAQSPLHSAREIRTAIDIGRLLNVRHELVPTGEMEQPAFRANSRDRCYVCKRIIFVRLAEEASRHGILHLAHGANRDDLSDYRPGMRAAAEMKVAAPLVEAALSKADIRLLARHLGLPNWDRPSMACLASRIPYGIPITTALLARVETAETLLDDLGFEGGRVRCHGEVARIELATPGDMGRALADACRGRLLEGMKSAGFVYVALDLEGYRQGSLNAGEARDPADTDKGS